MFFSTNRQYFDAYQAVKHMLVGSNLPSIDHCFATWPFICSMANQTRYKVAKKLAQAGQIKVYSDLFEAIPKKPLAIAIGTTPERLAKLIDNPELFMLRDIYNTARLIEVDEQLVIGWVHAEYLSKRKKKKG